MRLFDLTGLQRYANRRFGFSADRTLKAAQSLYERYKLLTYPRTDTQYLSDDIYPTVPGILKQLAAVEPYAPFIRTLRETDKPLPKPRRVFDDNKVSDHHAIIPTGKVPPASLPSDESKIFEAVTRRFIAAFFPDAVFAITDVVIRVGIKETHASASPGSVPPKAPSPTSGPSVKRVDHNAQGEDGIDKMPPAPDRYHARGRIPLEPGWQVVVGLAPTARPSGTTVSSRTAPGVTSTVLPPLKQGQPLNGTFKLVTLKTKPPPHHTEASLLSAMETAGRSIEDESLRDAMKECGLGTPATRASTIETLVNRRFINRDKKDLRATPTGIDLIHKLPVEALASPELTGSWEKRLNAIAQGQEQGANFMADIRAFVGDAIGQIQGAPVRGHRQHCGETAGKTPRKSPPSPRRAPQIGSRLNLTCPKCHQGRLLVGRKAWGCDRYKSGCDFVLGFEGPAGRWSDADLQGLVTRGQTDDGKYTLGPATKFVVKTTP